MPNNNQNWEERFDKEFGDYFPKISVSARQEGDITSAELLEKFYKSMPDLIKSFLRKEIRQVKIDFCNELLREFSTYDWGVYFPNQIIENKISNLKNNDQKS